MSGLWFVARGDQREGEGMRNYLSEDETAVIADRFEGWELVEFLDISIEEILAACVENDWINDDNIEDLLGFVRLSNDS